MDGASPTSPDAVATGTPQDRLDSWKDIAAYLKRSVPTVQRWEKDEALPVHRHLHRKQGSVYAYRGELDAWWRERRARLDAPRPEEPAGPVEETAAPVPSAPRRWPILAAGTVALVALAAVAFVAFRASRAVAPAAASGRLMVAILPFQNLGGGSNLDYVSDGLTEELITQMATVNPERLGIIARTSAMAYRSTQKTAREIGAELAVEYIVEGSVRFADGKSRITAQLIRVSDQSHLWARSYDGSPEEVLKLEQHVAQAVAAEVNTRLTQAPPRENRAATVDQDAYRLYLLGRQHWNKRSQADLERSIQLFEDALKHDPTYARAYAGLADSWNTLGYFGYRPLAVVIAKSQEAARRALELDEAQAGAHAALGYVNAMWLWDWAEAERRFERALQLDPNYVTAHHYYALFLASAGKLRQAQHEIATAVQLDPLAPAVNAGAGYVLFFDRQFARSLEYCQRAIDQDPANAVAHALRGWDLAELHRYPEAIAALRHALELAPDNALYVATLARAYALAGDRARTAETAAQLDALATRKWVGASMRAIVAAGQGDRDAAFKWLDDAIRQEDGFLLWAKVTPEFDPLRGDPRYTAVLNRLKLP